MSNIKDKLEKVGSDVRISAATDITRPELVSMGSHIAIDQWTYISTQLIMGDYIHIAPSVTILGGAHARLEMGNFTNIGSGSRIVCSTDDFKQGLISPVVPLKYRTLITEPIIFEDFATLGVNCTVLPGVTLAEGTIVGAGSVVTQDTKPWMIYAGSPAKPIKHRHKTRALEAAKELGYE
jgi:acetyltransferase-like isoleucine patch superfamily enzyme